MVVKYVVAMVKNVGCICFGLKGFFGLFFVFAVPCRLRDLRSLGSNLGPQL